MGVQSCIFLGDAFEGRKKKLIAGVRWSLKLSDSGNWDCSECDERKRDKRNCKNRKKLRYETAEREEWKQTANTQHVEKVLDTKFYACPNSIITGKTWQILKLVNETVDADCNILHLPYEGAYLDQPPWYREAVIIVRANRYRYNKEKVK